MSTQPDPAMFGVDFLIQTMMRAMTEVARRHNLTVTTNGKGNLWSVNQDVIVKAESWKPQIGENSEPDWTHLFTEIPYIPITPPPPPPTIHIQYPDGEIIPGVYTGAATTQALP